MKEENEGGKHVGEVRRRGYNKGRDLEERGPSVVCASCTFISLMLSLIVTTLNSSIRFRFSYETVQ